MPEITLTVDVSDATALRRVLGAGVEKLRRDFDRAQAASTRAQDARSSLPHGSTRARVTTANARWANAAEERDRVKYALDLAERLLAEVR